MKRILLIAGIFPPEIGGPATFIDHLAHELSQKGYRVTVVCNVTVPGADPSDKNRPFRVVRVYSRLWAIQIYKLIPILAWHMLWNDAVLVNGMEYSAYLASKLTGRKYFLKIVGDIAWEEARGSGETSLSIDEFQNESQITGRVKRLRDWRTKYLNYAQKVIVPSQYLRKVVSNWGVSKDNIHVVYNGVVISKEPFTKRERKSATDLLKVIFVGRLTNWKGVETLLLASQKIKDIEVNIVGDGPEYPLLVELAKQLSIRQRVKFWGSLDQDQVIQLMKRMHVLVLGSSYEGLSHTLLEACSLGLPCIASKIGGNPEVIKHKENGLLFPYGNVDALIDNLLLLKRNDEMRLRLSANAREKINKFDFEKTINATTKILLKVGE